MSKTAGAEAMLRRMRAYQERYRATIRGVMATQATVVTQRMRAEHRWQNRTGAAEAGLHCDLTEQPSGMKLTAAHGVSYGKYLETMQQSRFAVLLPTLRSQWPTTLRTVAAAVKEIKAQ